MKQLFEQFVIDSYNEIPMEVYEGLFFVFCFGVVVLFAIYGFKRCWKKVALLLFVEYDILTYCSTVICRNISEGIVGHNFSPFWSYEAIKNGREDLIAENIMNVAVFVPLGLLLGTGFRSMTCRKALMIGGGVSVSIEAMQFFLQRGFAETDDVMHNTIGCMIGYGLYSLIRLVYEKLSKRSVAVL